MPPSQRRGRGLLIPSVPSATGPAPGPGLRHARRTFRPRIRSGAGPGECVRCGSRRCRCGGRVRSATPARCRQASPAGQGVHGGVEFSGGEAVFGAGESAFNDASRSEDIGTLARWRQIAGRGRWRAVGRRNGEARRRVRHLAWSWRRRTPARRRRFVSPFEVSLAQGGGALAGAGCGRCSVSWVRAFGRAAIGDCGASTNPHPNPSPGGRGA